MVRLDPVVLKQSRDSFDSDGIVLLALGLDEDNGDAGSPQARQ